MVSSLLLIRMKVHGDSHYGYETVLKDLVKKISIVKTIAEEKNEKLVNLFGILPQKDIYFKGDLAEIKRILEGIGLQVNTFFGPDNGVEELIKAPNAALSIVFSKWGRGPADLLEEQYGIPQLKFSSVPTGPEAVAVFVEAVAGKLGVEEAIVKQFLQRESAEFDYYYQGIVDAFYEELGSRAIAVVGDESTVIQIGNFLNRYLGAALEIAVVTDYFGKSELSREEKSKAVTELAKQVYFTQDGKEIQDILLHNDVDLILGSSLETRTAEKKDLVNLELSYPVYGKAIINKTYAGNKGALTLIEDYLTAVKTTNQLKEQRLLEYIKQA